MKLRNDGKLGSALLGVGLGCVLSMLGWGADLEISAIDRAGGFSWSGAFTNGVCTVESAAKVTNQMSKLWREQQSYFTTNSIGQGTLPFNSSNKFFRLIAVDISANTPLGYSNLLRSYGHLHTLAGNGFGGTDGVNYWQPHFEGGYATNAALSRPHMAMADDTGNVFIVDKGSHSVLKVTPNGRIHTVAGTHVDGFNGDGPAPATTLKLSQPNGLYVHGEGTFYILDTGNGKVRRVDTNGTMTTLFRVPGGIVTGRGLWVDEDELQVGLCDGTTVKLWTAANGLTNLNAKFIDLGNLIPSSQRKSLFVTDRGDDKVYKVDISGAEMGKRTLVYGKGHGEPVVEGTWAVTNCLNGVRGIWRLPTDGYLLALHEGNQLLYVDPVDIVHVFVNGQTGAHSGDGQWFHSSGYKLSQVRSVTLDSHGNILIVEGDFGFVRKIDFQRLTP